MIRCIAVDDEPLALEQMVRFISRIPELELVGKGYSTAQAAAIIGSTDVDLIFLDIDMPDCNGMDFARSFIGNKPYIIFTTAYPQFAIEGYRLDAVDYLLKPISFEEMMEAVEKARRRLMADEGGKADDSRSSHIFIKSSGTIHKVAIDNIRFIRGLGEYVRFSIAGEKNMLTSFDSLKRLESELPNDNFMRIHKSYLVNLKRIESASRQSVVIDGETIPVGDKYRTALVDYLRRIS